ALSHDVYYKMIDPHASTQRRVTISKILLLGVALVAAYVTSLKPGDILFLVGAAFSLAAAAFFPALVLGVFWKRATKWGAIAGMVAGLGITMYLWGVPLGIITIIVVSLLTPQPSREMQELVEHVRYPHLRGDIDTQGT
nr:cation acetate symporter [Burkholderiales bacterium]